MNTLTRALADGLTMFGRHLTQLRRRPGELVAALLFPVLMIVMFGYVFGSAIRVPGGGNYREYLMPGLFGMVIFTAVMANALATATDAGRGVMDRLRSLPVTRWAMPFGQSAADLLTGIPGLAALAVCGLVVGWRPHEGAAPALAAFALMILMRMALGWLGIWLGLVMKDEKTVDAFAPIFLPVTMLSNAFVPTEGMPAWLRVLCEWNPVSSLVAALRELFGNPAAPATALPLQHPVAATVLWSLALIAVFMPLAVHAYTHRNR
ncbi:ABC transporter permease [Actinocorallia populi]|uniref:ABC transporter permease n=1 Tax=Actinocorallia populi TaxID=2079200 RepID=UPI001E4BEDDF|nr:ABC transporter permease [Actinocorallia populi]